MNKLISTIALISIAFASNAQQFTVQNEAATTKSVTNISILSPAITHEIAVGRNQTVFLAAGLNGISRFEETGNTNPKTFNSYYGLAPKASADFRNYYNFGKRLGKGKNINNNSGNYLALRAEYEFAPIVNKDQFLTNNNGFALGGGLELAMACHFRVASDNAKMGLPEVSLGVIPGYGGTQRLPQLVGKGRAMEMIMTAGMITADDALRFGLVNHVVLPTDLLGTCQNIAQKIIKNSPFAISQAIKAVNANYKDGTDGFKTEIKAFGKCFGTGEFIEGTTAFLEKRKASF